MINTDYKILSGAIAARLKIEILTIINETQLGFLKGKSINKNIRMVLDLLDYSEAIPESRYILFLDFYKAFDSVKHYFILKTLWYFGLGEKCINVIGKLYNGINSSVPVGHDSICI